MKKMGHRHILMIVTLCLFIAASVGLTTNVFGLFITPIVEEFGTGRGSISLALTLSNLFCSLGGMVIGRMISSRGYGWNLIAGSAVITGTTVLLSIIRSVAMLYILNALRGFVSGFVGTVFATMVINNWFYSSNGLISSVILGFSGLASAVFSPLLSGIIAGSGWRTAYLVSASLIAALTVPALFFPTGFSPKDAGTVPFGERKEVVADDEEKRPYSKKVFMLLFVYSLLSGSLTSVVQHFPGISDSYGLDRSVGATMLSIAMICNTSGKVLMGILTDRIGNRKAVSVIIAVVMAGFLSLLLLKTPVGMFLGSGLVGLAYSLATVAVVMLTRDKAGISNYGSVYPRLSFGVTLSYAAGTTLVGLIYDVFSSYSPVLYFLMAVLVMMTICIILLYRKTENADTQM